MTSATLLVLVGVLALAYANGANDNFKGVATLLGSGVADYRTALSWATVTVLLGSLCAALLAQKLIVTFTGEGLVPDRILAAPEFVTAVILGSALTVFGSAVAGIPISTTHALTGALAGAGLAALGPDIGWSTLGRNFLYPLGLSPLISIALVGLLYPAWTRLGPLVKAHARRPALHARVAFAAVGASLRNGNAVRVPEPAGGVAAAVRQRVSPLSAVHFLSAGAVGFARGLNDTPKIVGVALAGMALDVQLSVVFVALAMALGGLLQARRVARTMSYRITPMSDGQGALANLVTSGLVIFASHLGLPVSTTHVSCGALFGLGAATGRLNWGIAGRIVSAWFLTLPAAGAIAAFVYTVL